MQNRTQKFHFSRQQKTLLSLALIFILAACAASGGAKPAPSTVAGLPPVDVSVVSAADPGSTLADGWQHGAFMEIYVRGYNDSDGDGIGDLKGLIAKLDYLQALGIKGLWLMPVTSSQDHDHGYAVSDYRNIETQYGTLADMDELLKQAHARGIGVIMDYVVNHSAGQNPLFVHSAASPSNPYRDWYVWQNTAPAGWNIYGNNPWKTTSNGAYFAGFWDQMPDFNLRNPAVIAYHENGMRFWLNRGVDGFRIDAVGNLVENGPSAWESQPENYTIMNGYRKLVAGYSKRYMVCEAPGDSAGFGAPTACGSAFTFDHNGNIINAAKGDALAIQKGADYFKTANPNMASFVSNHDAFAGERLWDQLNGNIAQYKLAAATYLLMPGSPFIYYGEEIGMSGAKVLTGDPKLRTPMSWTADSSNAGFTTAKPFRELSANVTTQNAASQMADANSIFSFYQSMLTLRNTRASLAKGSYDAPFVSGKVMGFQRSLGAEKTLVLMNYGTEAASVKVAGLPVNTTLLAAYPRSGANAAVDASGNAQININGQTVKVYAMQ